MCQGLVQTARKTAATAYLWTGTDKTSDYGPASDSTLRWTPCSPEYRKQWLQVRLESGSTGCVVCVPQREVDPSFHGPGTAANQTDTAFANQGADRGTQAVTTGMGRVL